MTERKPIELECRDCALPYWFQVRDQEFFASQDPPWRPPVRCPDCRAAARKAREYHGQMYHGQTRGAQR